jgi:hypothetical protein
MHALIQLNGEQPFSVQAPRQINDARLIGWRGNSRRELVQRQRRACAHRA